MQLKPRALRSMQYTFELNVSYCQIRQITENVLRESRYKSNIKTPNFTLKNSVCTLSW